MGKNKSTTKGKTTSQGSSSTTSTTSTGTSTTSQATETRENVLQTPIVINAQYIKDLSFENPNPVKFFQDREGTPDINVSIDVAANGLGGKSYEVVLTMKAEAKRGTETMFIAELEYAGVFSLSGVQEQYLHPVLMIECPRMLFPFARSIMSEVTRDGGYPPLSLNPIDFASLYQQQMAAQKKAAGAEG